MWNQVIEDSHDTGSSCFIKTWSKIILVWDHIFDITAVREQSDSTYQGWILAFYNWDENFFSVTLKLSWSNLPKVIHFLELQNHLYFFSLIPKQMLMFKSKLFKHGLTWNVLTETKISYCNEIHLNHLTIIIHNTFNAKYVITNSGNM